MSSLSTPINAAPTGAESRPGRLRWILRVAASTSAMAASLGLVAPALGAAVPASESTPYDIIGAYPGPNIPTSAQYSAGLDDACNLGDSNGFNPPTEGSSAGSYVDDMNAWQGKPSAVISCYQAVSSGLFTNQVPEIWDVFHAIPMLNLGDSSYNTAIPSMSETSYSTLQDFGTALGDWIVGTDNLNHPAPLGGRRIFIRWDWEANGSWYTYSPLAQSPATCADLANDEVTYVDRWQQVYNAIMSAATAAAGANLANNVAWVYSVNAGTTLPANLANCPSTQGTGTVFQPVGALSGLTNAVTSSATVAQPSSVEASLYPMNNDHGPDYQSGTPYARWLGMDGYSFCTTEGPSQVFGTELNTLRRFSSLPASIDEVGASVVNGASAPCAAGTTPAKKGTLLTQLLAYVRTAKIKMSLLTNDDIYEGGEALDFAAFCEPTSENGSDKVCSGDSTYTSSSGITYDAYSEYPKALASTYFIGSGQGNPRFLTNAQFLGK